MPKNGAVFMLFLVKINCLGDAKMLKNNGSTLLEREKVVIGMFTIVESDFFDIDFRMKKMLYACSLPAFRGTKTGKNGIKSWETVKSGIKEMYAEYEG